MRNELALNWPRSIARLFLSRKQNIDSLRSVNAQLIFVARFHNISLFPVRLPKGFHVYESIRATTKPQPNAEVSVCMIFSDKTLHHCDQDFDAQHYRALSTTIKRSDVKGEVGEFTVTHGHEGAVLALLGLGKHPEFNAEKARAAAGGLLRGIHKLDAHRAHLSVPNEAPFEVNAPMFGTAFGEGIGLANYRFDDFRKPTREKPRDHFLTISLDSPEFADGIRHGVQLAESANIARRLASTPPNIATTTYVAEQARRLAQESGNLKCRIIAGEALEKLQFAGLANVGKASEHPPCMIELLYTPKKPAFTLLLIGKTICFDTGGLSIKPRESMRGMKYDKCGGMAVLGAMHAVSRIKPKFRVAALLPTAENAISHNALRVDDIIHYPNGVTVEVTNTDAEGRLVLADALIYGVHEYKPAAVIDLATLTGGVVVGLGKTFAGYWCEDDALRYQLETAAHDSGERIWRLPMHEEYKDLMKAKHADTWNSAPTRDAHPIQGAAFLSYFIDSKIPWAHIDIAGTADIDKDKPPYCAGPTGFGVRLLASLIENWK
jgi:leucyl aminopeptidase